jgi:hypothetical protein
VRRGFRWLIEFAEKHGYSEAAIVVSSLHQVEDLVAILAVDASALKARILQGDGVTVNVYTERSLPSLLHGIPVLGVWVDDKQLDKLDDLLPPGICAIPWNRVDIDGWKQSWNATDVRTGEAVGSQETVTNPVVAAAMASLTTSVKLSTGLGHPSDKASAVQMFKALKKANEVYSPDEIRGLAVRSGWRSKDARELSELGQKVLDGRPVQGSKREMWREDIVEIWRQEARKKSG